MSAIANTHLVGTWISVPNTDWTTQQRLWPLWLSSTMVKTALQCRDKRKTPVNALWLYCIAKNVFFSSSLVWPLLPTLVGVKGYCCTWSHSTTQIRTLAVGLLWMRDRPSQRPPPNTQYRHPCPPAGFEPASLANEPMPQTVRPILLSLRITSEKINDLKTRTGTCCTKINHAKLLQISGKMCRNV
jgi:hypothetical protein